MFRGHPGDSLLKGKPAAGEKLPYLADYRPIAIVLCDRPLGLCEDNLPRILNIRVEQISKPPAGLVEQHLSSFKFWTRSSGPHPASQKVCKCLPAFMLLLCSEIANQRRFRIITVCSAKLTQNQFVVWFRIIVVLIDKIISALLKIK